MNELLTTYLPCFLILSIVYATNYFKPFFFEVSEHRKWNTVVVNFILQVLSIFDLESSVIWSTSLDNFPFLIARVFCVQAVVTVNLTSLLVLTTLFTSVSGTQFTAKTSFHSEGTFGEL